jgi:hypothetical protein
MSGAAHAVLLRALLQLPAAVRGACREDRRRTVGVHGDGARACACERGHERCGRPWSVGSRAGRDRRCDLVAAEQRSGALVEQS